MKRIRWDFFICLVVGTLLMGGLVTGVQKMNVSEKIMNSKIGTEESQADTVEAGEIGGKAVESTPRVSTVEELIAAEGTFTIEMSEVAYMDTYTYTGEEYEWRLLEIDDLHSILARVNKDAIVETEGGLYGTYILPVGTLVREAPVDGLNEVESDQIAQVAGDCYIDMDGEANTTKVDGGLKFLMKNFNGLMLVLILAVFAIYMGIILGIHKIGVKVGIFPGVKLGKIVL